MSYTKLWASIVDSTIWDEDDTTRIVWVTLLAKANRRGIVLASLPGLARCARKTIKETEAALEKLKGPDPHSRTKDFEGRRIAEIEGGWLLLNYEKHREGVDVEQALEKARLRAKNYRDRKKQGVTPRHAASRPVTPDSGQSRTVPPPAPSPEPTPTPENPPSSLEPVRQGVVIVELPLDATGRPTIPTRFVNERDAVRYVFDYWRSRTDHLRASWNDERQRRLLTRLREEPGGLIEKVRGLCLAVEGALLDPLHNGSEKGRAYLEFENIFVHQGRNRIEKLQGVALGAANPRAGGPLGQKDLEASNRMAVEQAIGMSKARLKP